MKLIQIYEGGTLFAEMLRDELKERGIGAVVRPQSPFYSFGPQTGMAALSIVLVPEDELELRPDQIQECLAMVSTVDEPG